MGIRIGVDTGGTFTDFVVASADGVEVSKVLSTPDRPEAAIVEGLERIATSRGVSIKELLGDVEIFIHGTTIATNTVLQGNGPRLGLIGTEGFRDVLELRDGYKKDRYNVHLPPREAFVPRHLRIGVTERIGYTGEVETPLDVESVRRAIAHFKSEGVEAIAVSLLWSMLNPRHEEEIRRLVAEEMPDAYVAISSDILPAIREYPRTSSTALSAYVGPVLGKYLGRISQYLKDNGYRYDLLIMQVTGGAALVQAIERRPVLAIGSGPAAGPAAGKAIGSSTGDDDLMVIDMGGTSFEVSLISDGAFTMTQAATLADMPIGVPAVEIESIGAGGGSIAWLDSGGMLRVGPASAGASPGPACYDLGGEEPTVTDANIILGYLDPEGVLGGTIRLRKDLAERAMQKIAKPLGLSIPEAAAAVFEIVNSNMAGAMRSVSVMRGIDPRKYTVINGGGAGGIHVAQLSAALGIKRFISPAVAGGLCAYGMLASDVRQSTLVTLPRTSENIDIAEINEMFRRREEEGRAAMRKQGFPNERIRFERAIDAKYPIQTHSLLVSIPNGTYESAQDLAAAFHSAHERLYTYALREMPVDMSGWHLTVIGELPALPVRYVNATESSDAEIARVKTRDVYYGGKGSYVSTPVYDGERLRPGMSIRGSAIIELPTTTLTLFPANELTVQPNGDLSVLTAST